MFKDSIGQEIHVGDYIAWKEAYSSTEFSHGRIESFTKNNRPEVMVHYFDEPHLKSVRTIFVKTFIQEDI